MSDFDPDVLAYVLARERDGAPCRLAPPALAYGPVADTAETVTPQTGIVGAEPDRDDLDAMGHG